MSIDEPDRVQAPAGEYPSGSRSAPADDPTLHPGQGSERPKMTLRSCWYFVHQWYCVLCGRSEETRDRRYTPRPDHWGDRHDYEEGACGDHFC